MVRLGFSAIPRFARSPPCESGSRRRETVRLRWTVRGEREREREGGAAMQADMQAGSSALLCDENQLL